jgi:hypothetical protein
MSSYSHETAPTRCVEAEGVRFAYRRFGKSGDPPLLFLQYFNANMDDWDPFVTNVLPSIMMLSYSTMPASALSYFDAFLIFAVVGFALAILVFFMRRSVAAKCAHVAAE